MNKKYFHTPCDCDFFVCLFVCLFVWSFYFLLFFCLFVHACIERSGMGLSRVVRGALACRTRSQVPSPSGVSKDHVPIVSLVSVSRLFVLTCS
jgi:hypothetical protein